MQSHQIPSLAVLVDDLHAKAQSEGAFREVHIIDHTVDHGLGPFAC